jgi:hypothetical protein
MGRLASLLDAIRVGHYDVAGRVCAALLALFALISAVHAIGNAMALMGSKDIGASIRAAQVLQQQDPYALFLSGKGDAPGKPGPGGNPFAMEPVQVPSALMLLWPYSSLSWPALKVAWLISNFVFTAGLLILAFRRFLPGEPLWLYICISALFVMSSSWRNIITNGQHGLASLFFLMAAAELADRRRSVAAGTALAFGLMKYSMTMFLLPWFVLKRQWVPLAIAIGLHVLTTMTIALWLQVSPITLISGAIHVGRETLLVQGFLDLFALSTGLGLPPAVPAVVSMTTSAAILWIALRGRIANENVFVAALCFLALTLVYHRPYDYILLIVPLLVAIRYVATLRLAALMIFASVALIWFLDRPVVFLTDWLESRNSPYYFFLATVWYATLGTLLVIGVRPAVPEAAAEPL